MGKKGGGKAALATEPEDLKHLDVSVNDIIQTPLGVLGTVVGLEKESQASSTHTSWLALCWRREWDHPLLPSNRRQ